MKQRLHIVIASELYEFAGGCESWLKYFLAQGMIRNEYFQDVHIYHVFPQQFEQSFLKDLHEQPKFVFHSYHPKHSLVGNGIRTIYVFTKYCLKRMIFPKDSKHVVLLIGSVYLAILGVLLHYKCLFKKNVYIIPWIRSIAAQENAGDNKKKQIIYKFLEYMLLNRCNGIIVNGQDTLTSYRKLYPALGNKMRVVENAVNHAIYAGLNIPSWRKKKISCAYLGRFVPAKGFDDFLQSVKVFCENNDTTLEDLIEFHIYGHGRLDKNIPQCIQNHGTFSPSQVKNILGTVDVVVFLNKTNIAAGLSHGLLEAMAAGRLIIAWENAIHCQVLSEENAILLREGDISGLADIYQQLTTGNIDAGILHDKCEAARRKARDYSVEKHIETFNQVIAGFTQS